MPKNKLERFAELQTFPNCIYMSYQKAFDDRFELKGKWNAGHFRNANPIILELGCGKGEYTVGLARRYPHRNIIGVDIKGNRIWVGAKAALDEKLDNAAFLRARIDFIDSAFASNEVSEIWITFPDPQPTRKGEKKRLTSPRFLERYKKILGPGGIIHLKTDSVLLYEYTLEIIRENKLGLIDSTNDLYGSHTSTAREEVKSIRTYYEAGYLAKGMKINYLAFAL
ncbi:MAG TPA: tRNA (guanosine(46)-N7)-methyltransferase TrmB [Bacteroidia bacterium]|jgi:tRNA (guanine-N7-)-methyltransferase